MRLARTGPDAEAVLVEEGFDALEERIEQRRAALGQRTSSAIVRSVSGSWLWTMSVVTPQARQASSRSAISLA